MADKHLLLRAVGKLKEHGFPLVWRVGERRGKWYVWAHKEGNPQHILVEAIGPFDSKETALNETKDVRKASK